MEIAESSLDQYVLISLAGEMDASNAPELEAKVNELLEAGKTELVFECSRLDYVASAGLRVFVMTAKKLKRAEGKLGMAGMQDLVKDVFVMAGLDDLFNFFPSPAEAVKTLG